jgi:hypothetical protein
MENFKYFDWGYPGHPKLPQIGLYNPTFDCFILTVASESVARIVKAVISSRYTVYPVYLSTADNYTSNLIDNSNCENWSFSNTDQISLPSGFIDSPIYHAYKLTDSARTYKTIGWDITIEKQWALLIMFWVKKIEEFKLNKPCFIQADSDINRFLELDEVGYLGTLYQAQEKQILKTLYLGKNFNEVDSILLDIGKPFL